MSKHDSSHLPPQRNDQTTSLDSDPAAPGVAGNALNQRPVENLGDFGQPTIAQIPPPEKLPGKSFDQIIDLLQRLSVPSRRQGSLGRIDTYEILGVVGQGAMGVVLRAFDESLQRVVAIKLMAPHLLSSTTAKERFHREARSAAGVSHPNVVTIHAVSEINGVPYLVMEFIEGESLEQRIRVKPFDALDVLRIAHQMASGLAAAHNQGLVHRDIKPSNIMLEAGIDRVRIADFGLARVAMEQSTLTSDGQIVGTPAYMSPEQVNGDQLDPRSDLFSVGCVMYSMLTGHSPFEARNGIAAWRAVLTKQPEPLQNVCLHAPRFLCDVVHRLLEKEPALRFQSADELAAELTRNLRTWNLSTDAPTVQLKTESRRSRQPTAVLVTAAIAIVALVAVVSGLPQFARQFNSDSSPSASRDNTADKSPQSDQSLVASDGRSAAGPRRITVARDGSARYLTLKEAVAAAKPGSVIQILDQGPYYGPIKLGDPDRHRGLKIVGHESVIINDRAEAIIQINGVADISIEGLVLNANGHQHAIEILGDCPSLLLQKSQLQVIDPSQPSVSLIYLHQGAAGTEQNPITLRDLDLHFGGVAIVLNEPESSKTTRHIQVMDCRFAGSERQRGIPVILFDGVQNVQINRNLMEVGNGALSLILTKPDSVQDFEFSGNTLRNFEAALYLNESTQLSQHIRIRHNLLLDIAHLPVSESQLNQIAGWFAGNVWMHAGDSERTMIERIAERRDHVALIESTPSGAQYLVPVDTDIQAGRDRWQKDTVIGAQ